MLRPVHERQAALEARFPRWVPRTIDAALDEAAREFPDDPYVVTDERSWTYREVQEWSVRLAHGLVQAGVQPGDHVGLMMANYPEFVAVKYAISRAGAVCIPINFLNRRDELGYVVRQSNAVLLVTMDRFRNLDYLGMLDELAPGWESGGGGDAFPRLRKVVVLPTSPEGGRPAATTVQELGATAEGWQPVAASDPDSPADVLYTSGTTGDPKGVLLTHDMLLRTAYGSAYGRAFQPGHRVLFSLPMYHVYGYLEGLLAVLFVGGSIVPQLVFDPMQTLRGIERHRADDVLLIPVMTLGVLDAARQGDHDLSSLTAVISSGGQSPAGIWDEIFELLQPEEVTTGYGMSETTGSTTVTRPDDPRDKLLTTNGRLRDVGVAGDPALGNRLAVYKVIDPETGEDLPPGSVGELLVRGPGVTPGYYDKPQETAAAFTADGWLRTGDLGRLDDDYLTLVGRNKDVYRCGGEQVVPKQVEDVLTTHPSVAQAHIVPLKDQRMGEVGVAYVVFKPGASATEDELIGWCAERVARFKVPKHVLPIAADQIPSTASGRPRKFLLAEMAAQRLGVA
ncbi:MAG: AMP-dependent synthetase and ligase [Frankiales bacterium]|nr:AMP-dependent synthetase and ligase [Frankiales bacterium]